MQNVAFCFNILYNYIYFKRRKHEKIVKRRVRGGASPLGSNDKGLREYSKGKCFREHRGAGNVVEKIISTPDRKGFTLAEGAEPRQHIRHWSKGFTLAEVLITLAIIGVVAAMTIPTLISNYKKKETVTKLKQTYSILSQAVYKAQAKNGDVSTWGFSGITGSESVENVNKENSIKILQEFIFPEIKVAKNYGYAVGKDILYDGLYFPVSHTKQEKTSYWFTLPNGVLVRGRFGDHCNSFDQEGNCTDRVFIDFNFAVDVNGFEKPNTQGIDVFILSLDMQTGKFNFHNYGEHDRASYINFCNGDDDSQICGYLIFLDGWKIADDYPWL